MPLSKTVEYNNTGVNVTYWRECPVTFDPKQAKIFFAYDGYIDSPSYLAGKNPVTTKTFTMDCTVATYLANTGTQMVVMMRDYAKTYVDPATGQAFFSGAVNAA
jgi:hypothetical protein